ncbi:glycosyltransferase [archaeon]|nr:MAG: glycosyltransferase [archaeon]
MWRQMSPRGKVIHEPKPGSRDLPRKRTKISVVIPARNEETTLPTCLEGLCRQSLQDFEIIVVDSDLQRAGLLLLLCPEW